MLSFCDMNEDATTVFQDHFQGPSLFLDAGLKALVIFGQTARDATFNAFSCLKLTFYVPGMKF